MATVDEAELERFLSAYIECALWSSLDNYDEGGKPLDENYGRDDLASETSEKMRTECRDFMEANAEDLARVNTSQAGMDFWLTRNRHGAGFWDRGLGEVGTRLTEAAHAYGECSLYIGDDGKLYV